MNDRITPRERGLLKGALRRVFSRSELREAAMSTVRIEHSDLKRPRCKKWGYCQSCGEVTPEWRLTVDHISPVIPVSSSFEELGLDGTADRLWCSLNNLQVLCESCHDSKSSSEKAERKSFKNKNKSDSVKTKRKGRNNT